MINNYSISQMVKKSNEDIAPSASTPPGGDEEGAGALRGLSYSNKVFVDYKKIKLLNTETGEFIEIDKDQQRISRMRKRVFAWADMLGGFLQDKSRYRLVMLTLTYAKIDDWRPKQITKFMLDMRKRLGENLLGYAWVAEMQSRGAVHYHVLLIVKKGSSIPKPDKSGLWPWGITRIETARTHFYICTYVGKEHQKMGDFPKGLRMFAIWIKKGIITKLQKWFLSLSSLPSWLCNIVKGQEKYLLEKIRRDPGGGWVIAGEKFRSPFQLVAIY